MNERTARIGRVFRAAGYWLVSLTWGGLMTWLGAFIALVMLLTGHAPKRLGPNVYFEVGLGWGGMEYGAFFFVARDASEETRLHEAGHGIQNLVLGPMMPFLVCIPSALRYWMRRCKTLAGKRVFSGAVCLILALLGAAGLTAAALLGLSGGMCRRARSPNTATPRMCRTTASGSKPRRPASANSITRYCILTNSGKYDKIVA